MFLFQLKSWSINTFKSQRTERKPRVVARLVFVDGSDAADRQSDGLLLPGDDDLVLGQAGRGDADASARLLAQLLHQPVVGSGDEGVEGLLQGVALHRTLVLTKRRRVTRASEGLKQQKQSYLDLLMRS